jgi:DNA repair photolyase
MRWDAQKLEVEDPALPGLALRGLVRTVRTPDFAGITFHEVQARSALNKVPAASQMPFRWTINPMRGCSHACAYCLHPDTLVAMADGRQRPIGALVPGDLVLGTKVEGRYRRYVETPVLDVWSTRKRAYRVTLADGTWIVASGDHRFRTTRGWKHVTGTGSGTGQRPHLTLNDKLIGFGLGRLSNVQVTAQTASYRRGYLTGMIRGDGMILRRTYVRRTGALNNVTAFRLALADIEALDRAQRMLEEVGIPTHRRPFPGAPHRRPMTAIHTARGAHLDAIEQLIGWPDRPDLEWQRGFLAGIFDAEGGTSRGVVRISNRDAEMLEHTMAASGALGFRTVLEPPAANGVRTVRLLGGLPAVRRFMHLVDPAITRKRGFAGAAVKSGAPLHVVAVEDLGVDIDMRDITTGTGDFIANGVMSHNCFARPTHEYLELDAGHDFESQIVVKTNVVEVLRTELARPSWVREHVALGTNTDPYQRAEGRYRLMPGIVEALAASGTPLSVLTKGTLLKRDLPVLAAAAEQVPVGIGVSLAVGDEELQQALEPGTPTPRARLDLIRTVRDAGLGCGVMVAPVLPWLTDTVEHLDDLLGRLAEAGATGVTVLPLHLRGSVKPLFLGWLRDRHPALVGRYEALYGPRAYAPADYVRWLGDRVRPLLVRHGFAGGSGHRRDRGERLGEGAFPSGSLPGLAATEAAAPGIAQPTLF